MTTKQKPKSDYTSVAGLKARGWTDRFIKDLLGEPDKLGRNPHYRSAAPVRLYEMTRVIEVELTDKFKSKPDTTKQKLAAKKAANTKRQALLDYIERLEITIPAIPFPELLIQACDSYNSWNLCNDKFAQPTDSKDFLNRITVNFLRHECSAYESELYRLFGVVGKQEGYRLLKERVLEEIADVYPCLTGECHRQQNKLQ